MAESDKLTFEEQQDIVTHLKCDGPLPIVFTLGRGYGTVSVLCATLHTTWAHTPGVIPRANNPGTYHFDLPTREEFMAGIYECARRLYDHELRERLQVGTEFIKHPHPCQENHQRVADGNGGWRY